MSYFSLRQSPKSRRNRTHLLEGAVTTHTLVIYAKSYIVNKRYLDMVVAPYRSQALSLSISSSHHNSITREYPCESPMPTEQYNCVRGNVELGTVTKGPEDPPTFTWVSPHLANHSQAKFRYLCSRKALAFF